MQRMSYYTPAAICRSTRSFNSLFSLVCRKCTTPYDRDATISMMPSNVQNRRSSIWLGLGQLKIQNDNLDQEFYNSNVKVVWRAWHLHVYIIILKYDHTPKQHWTNICTCTYTSSSNIIQKNSNAPYLRYWTFSVWFSNRQMIFSAKPVFLQ